MVRNVSRIFKPGQILWKLFRKNIVGLKMGQGFEFLGNRAVKCIISNRALGCLSAPIDLSKTSSCCTMQCLSCLVRSFLHSFIRFSQKSEKLSLFMVFAQMAAGMSKMDAKADHIVSNKKECSGILWDCFSLNSFPRI